MIPKKDARTCEDKDDADKLREIEDHLDMAIRRPERPERPIRYVAEGVSMSVIKSITELYANGGWVVSFSPLRKSRAFEISLS